MSQENVDVVRRVYDALARGEFGSTLDVYDPYVVFVQRDERHIYGLEVEGVYWGLDGLRDYMRKFLELWRDVTFAADEIIEAGDSVVAGIVMRMVGRESGVPVEGPYFHVWTFRGGSVIRLEALPTRAEALEAVGLAE
jgi:ketosteroid isomerase-like protein